MKLCLIRAVACRSVRNKERTKRLLRHERYGRPASQGTLAVVGLVHVHTRVEPRPAPAAD
jgi:hypothetical protein